MANTYLTIIQNPVTDQAWTFYTVDEVPDIKRQVDFVDDITPAKEMPPTKAHYNISVRVFKNKED